MKQKTLSSLTIAALVLFHVFFATAQTLDAPAPADTDPPVISGVAASSVGSSDVTIIWSTDEAATSSLVYGTTDAYGSAATLPATAALAHSAMLTDLTPGTIYYYCVTAVDTSGNTAESCGHTFTTQQEEAEEPACSDSDNDGICDTDEIGDREEPTGDTSTSTPETFPDTDSDGIPNYIDADDDGDGIPTETENATSTSDTETTTSTSTDSVADSDGDTVPDYLEPNTADTDGDGVTNNMDPDDDGDTVPTADDGTVADDPVDPVDTDSDGTADYLDADDDGDAIPTADEETATSTDPVATDTDGDTVPDYLESNTEDIDGDGAANVADPDDDGDTVPTEDEVVTDTSDTDAAANETVDTDNDGTPNYLDSDDDGDGTPTAEEDANHNGTPLDDDADADSIPDFEEPDNADTDGDGVSNEADYDDDGDSVPTVVERQAHNAPALGYRGGSPGTAVTPFADTDKDAIPDYLDPDDDGDGIPTKEEDANKDDSPGNDDTDSDGVPDYKESNKRDLDKDGKKDNVDSEDDGDGILTKIDSNPYSEACYAPDELGYAVYVVSPDGEKRTAALNAQKTVIASGIIRYDFELGIDNDFNDVAVRVNDQGHRSFIVTVIQSEVRSGYKVHLEILGNGEVEKDLTLWTNPRSSVNVPERIEVNRHIDICGDHEDFCPAHITQYMRKGRSNDPAEVSKLQTFLIEKEGFADLQATGVFDDATDAAVRAFQEKHANLVLGPWGIQRGTGYVYRTTTKRINDLYCAFKRQ